MQNRKLFLGFFLLIFFIIFFLSINTAAQSNEDCLDCHNDNEISHERNGKEISLFVNSEKFSQSVHADIECIDCHEGFDPDDIPHKEGNNIYKVDCSNCHDTEDFSKSIHGVKNLACFECHSKHEISEASLLQSNEQQLCLSCHNQQSVKTFLTSVHGLKNSEGKQNADCVDCHNGSAHTINVPVRNGKESLSVCEQCHENEAEQFESSLHGKAVLSNKILAPTCIKCHGSHNILPASNEKSRVYVMNIPSLCGSCHKEGTPVSKLSTVSQDHVLEDYSESIHGEGLLKRGLVVTAVCTSCHFSHNILPHENPKSSINKKNIASTCMQCHRQIESVHVKVINGELWEKEPHKIPACIDCHQPHKARRVVYEEDFRNELCMQCHSDKNLSMTKNGEIISLFVDIEEHNNSAHKDNSCIKCHTNISITNNPICLNSGKVDCSICHDSQVTDYNISEHGKEFSAGNKNAPTCITCHGKHDVMKKSNVASPTFKTKIPTLCGECHGKETELSKNPDFRDDVVKDYSMSIHGKGLLESGLTVTASCVDCHTSHRELKASNPISAVHDNNIAATCAKCHQGIYEEFRTSIHHPDVSDSEERLPNCSDCHSSHTIERVDKADFRQTILNQCGECHKEVTETYFDTFHGKVSILGSEKTAKCHDCHGSHNILPPFNPKSTLSRNNIIETCQTCHPNSNRKFVGYLTHATHHDKDKFPILYYTFWAMSILLVGTFTFFGLHTLLWLPRALAEKKKRKQMSK